MSNVNAIQVGGSHYKNGYQHWDFVLMFGLGYFEGQITKYVTRHRRKKGLEDLEKAVHFAEKMLESHEAELVHPAAVPLWEYLNSNLEVYAEANGLNEREVNIIRRCTSWKFASDIRLVVEEIKVLIQETYPNATATEQATVSAVLHTPAHKLRQQKSEILSTRDWFIKAGQMQDPPQLDFKQVGFYIGMQCEELAEKLEALFGQGNTTSQLSHMGDLFKKGAYTNTIAKAWTPMLADQLLDGDCDLLWVTIGSMYAQGADGYGAFGAVGFANWDKFRNGVMRDANGKVVKPTGWKAPNLIPYTAYGSGIPLGEGGAS